MINDQNKLNKILYGLILIHIPFHITFAFPIFDMTMDTKNIIGIGFTLIVSIVILKKEMDKNKAISIISVISFIVLDIKLVGIVLIAILFSLISNKSYLSMYFITVILTCFGLFCRYTLEYGEVSNERDFTIKNVVSTLIFMPILAIIITVLIKNNTKNKKD